MHNTPNTSVDEDAWLDKIFKKMNGSGAHACYCDRSTDGGCTCAIKDEYVAEVKSQIKAHIQEAVVAELIKWRPMVRRLSEYVESPDSLVEFNERIISLTNTERKDGE